MLHLAFFKICKVMKTVIILFFSNFLFLVVKINAQTSPSSSNIGRLSKNDWSSILRGNQPLITKKKSDVELRGTPFLLDTWENGSLILSDTSFFKNNVKFKLNLEDNEIWIQLENKEELVLVDKRILGVDFVKHDDTLSIRKVLLPDVKSNPQRFVQMLYNGKNFTLIKKTDKEFQEANGINKGVAVIGRDYDSYTTVSNYYILNDKKQYRRIALKKKDIYQANLSLVNNNRDVINTFCKENNIFNPLEEEDAIELVRFLDTLK
jgi:hypothetical protein